MVGEERKIIYAHKCQLAARCEVFKAMFAVQKEEAQLESPPVPLVLSDIKPTIFLAVLEFIYTNCSSLSTEIVIDVLAASIEYGLDGLTKVDDLTMCLLGLFKSKIGLLSLQLCVRYMRESIVVDTVCEFAQV